MLSSLQIEHYRINYCCTRDASSLLDAQNALHDVLISLQDFLNSFEDKNQNLMN